MSTVIRTDLLSGTAQEADLVSFRFYNGDAMAEVENGTIVKLGDLEVGQREVFKGTAATASDVHGDCVVAAGVEVIYDEHKHNLDAYTNEAGKIVRGYRLRDKNIFSITANGFVGNAPAVGGTVGFGANGKLDATKDNFGKCIAIESEGRYTYYVIQIVVA